MGYVAAQMVCWKIPILPVFETFIYPAGGYTSQSRWNVVDERMDELFALLRLR